METRTEFKRKLKTELAIFGSPALFRAGPQRSSTKLGNPYLFSYRTQARNARIPSSVFAGINPIHTIELDAPRNRARNTDAVLIVFHRKKTDRRGRIATKEKTEASGQPFLVRKNVENAPYSHENRLFLKKIAFFFVFPLDNVQVLRYIELTLNLEECP